MQPLYIILGVIVIFLVLLHLTKQNDDIVEQLETVCIGRTCVDENQLKNIINSNAHKVLNYRNNKLFIDAPVEIRTKGVHGGLNIRKDRSDGNHWNYIQFLNNSGGRTAWGGSLPGGRFGSGR